MAARRLLPIALTWILACSDADVAAPGGAAAPCQGGLELFRGACVDPATRYEPAVALDADNVSSFGPPPQTLALPPPPRSGFRLVAPPRRMEAGEETSFCLSWPIPEITRKVVYAGRLYTTPGLHHSNVIAKPVSAELGDNPYPECHPGASDPFADIGTAVPDVLFANSTQVVGTETLAFPPGMGWPIDTTREVSTSIHFLNATAQAVDVEVVYDFFTMEEGELTDEVAPFFMQMNDFVIPPHSVKTIGSDCRVFGGKVVSLMPHTHQWATRFTVDLLPFAGGEQRVMDQVGYDLASDIQLYQPPLDLTEVDRIRYQCTFDNVLDHELRYGLGENEMCILFGYITPPVYQLVGVAQLDTSSCLSVQLGLGND
jgi:hypothetical protein